MTTLPRRSFSVAPTCSLCPGLAHARRGADAGGVFASTTVNAVRFQEGHSAPRLPRAWAQAANPATLDYVIVRDPRSAERYRSGRENRRAPTRRRGERPLDALPRPSWDAERAVNLPVANPTTVALAYDKGTKPCHRPRPHRMTAAMVEVPSGKREPAPRLCVVSPASTRRSRCRIFWKRSTRRSATSTATKSIRSWSTMGAATRRSLWPTRSWRPSRAGMFFR